MIFRYYKTPKGKCKSLAPLGAQKKFLLSLPYEKQGENFNGYGYQDENRYWSLTPYQLRKYNSLSRNWKPSQTLTEEEKKERWCKRLAKLAEIKIEEAEEISYEKEEYHQERIDELEDRQDENYSRKRETLINQIRRENPLRRIVDIEHAFNIISASNRHKKTNYESLLKEAQEKAKIGELDHEDIKSYAREKIA